MTKQILPNELAEIVTGLLIKPELLGELDSREAHQAFMLDIGRVIADHCGGRINGITDGDVAKPYLSDIECTPILHIEPDDWIGPYISIHFLSLNPLLVRRRRYSRGERYPSALCGCHSL